MLILPGFADLICFDYASRNPRVRLTLDSWECLRAAHNLSNRGVLYAGDLSKPPIPALYSRRPPLYPSLSALALFCWYDVRAVVLVLMGLSLASGYLLWRLLGFLDISGGAVLSCI